MNDKEAEKGTATWSWLVGLVAIALIYALSIGPAFWLVQHVPLFHDLGRQVDAFFGPLYWCMHHVPGCRYVMYRYLALWGWDAIVVF